MTATYVAKLNAQGPPGDSSWQVFELTPSGALGPRLLCAFVRFEAPSETYYGAAERSWYVRGSGRLEQEGAGYVVRPAHGQHTTATTSPSSTEIS